MKEIEIYAATRRELSDIDGSHTVYGKLYSQYLKNVHTVYPNRDKEQNIRDFRRTLFYQRLAYRQQHVPFRWKESMETPLPEPMNMTPGIILTAHTYSYRNIVRYLAQKGLSLCLLVARRVYGRQKNEFETIMKEIYGNSFSLNFRLVEAEDPAVLLKLRRAHNEGMYILGYVDGNTGSAVDDLTNSHLQTVQFGNANMRVRTGLFRIALWLKCPVYPVWTAMSENYKTIFLFQPAEESLTSESLEMTVQKVYSSLESAVARDPAQWECFLYLEDFLCE